MRSPLDRQAAALMARTPAQGHKLWGQKNSVSKTVEIPVRVWEPTCFQGFQTSEQLCFHQNCRRRQEKDVQIKPCKISVYSWYAFTLWWALHLAFPLGHQRQSLIGPSKTGDFKAAYSVCRPAELSLKPMYGFSRGLLPELVFSFHYPTSGPD